MPSRTYQDYSQNTPITAAWLNAVNQFIYGTTGSNSISTPLAWVRFDGTTATILQSEGVFTVVRNSAGNYTISYSQTLAQAANVYNITTNISGFAKQVSETTNSVTIQITDKTDTAADPTVVSLVVFGAYAVQF
jgi:hypothetical protein